jgi:hypothetical protein
LNEEKVQYVIGGHRLVAGVSDARRDGADGEVSVGQDGAEAQGGRVRCRIVLEGERRNAGRSGDLEVSSRDAAAHVLVELELQALWPGLEEELGRCDAGAAHDVVVADNEGRT